MSNNDETEKIKELSIQELLSGEDRYEIPLYQRNYAWKRGEIEQLIQDVIDYIPKNPNENKDQNYYIGTLIVFENENEKYYEVLDGQQRLTTLVLLVAYLKHSGELAKHLNEHNIKWGWLDDFNEENGPIRFRSRDDYKNALKEVLTNRTEETEVSTEILDGYYDIENIFLEGVLSENKQTLKNFCDFLLENVKIMRIPIPPDTDRHHYFEIMNSRGKQLEKHEILKARMIDALHDEQSRSCFSIVWDVCANMGHYVQIRFSEEERNAVFGENWDSFCVKDFEELQEKINPKISNDSEYPTLSQIINSPNQNGDDNDDDQNGDKNENNNIEFKSIIDFPKFLLHVLRVQEELDRSLNDNQLIPEFEHHILNDSKKVKKFAYNLLLCKFLYDQYIIKINLGSIDETGRWSLKRLKKQNDNSEPNYVHTFGEENNKRIIMLLSSLHVSETGPAKHWLDAALKYLVSQKEQDIEAKSYLKHMEEVATSFVFGSEISNLLSSYQETLQEEEEQKKKIEEYIKDLSYPYVRRRIFHFLDYLLWLKYKDNRNYPKIELFKNDFPKITDFEFTTSNDSVEHHSPQNPEGGGEPPKWLHLFGNLCLISRSKNSALSNETHEDKRDRYKRGRRIESVKQYLMMNYETWNEKSIQFHYDEIKMAFFHWLEDKKLSKLKISKDEEKEEHYK